MRWFRAALMIAIAGAGASAGLGCEERTSPLLSSELQAQRDGWRAPPPGPAAPESTAPGMTPPPPATGVGEVTDDDIDPPAAATPSDPAAHRGTGPRVARTGRDQTSFATRTSPAPSPRVRDDDPATSPQVTDAPSPRAAIEVPPSPPAAQADPWRPSNSPSTAPAQGRTLDPAGSPSVSSLPAPSRGLPSSGRLARVEAGDLCVTRGDLAKTRVAVPTFRAVAKSTGGDAASMRFVVNGETEKSRALASGQKRRQLGLKLRAQDGCNLVYVMWRLDPKPKLDVSVKLNPGERTAKQCGAGGYTKVKPARVGSLPTLDDGTEHELRAQIRGDQLTAWVDGEVAWEGRLPAGARDLAGPVGVRSDNLAFELRGLDGDTTSAARVVAAKCVAEESD